MSLRQRKHALLNALNLHVRTGLITPFISAQFEARYRRCRSEAEQEAIRQEVIQTAYGFKDNPQNVYDKLRAVDADPEDDEDPPALREALARYAYRR